MLNFKKDDIVVVEIKGQQILGRVAKVIPGDDTVFLEYPCEIKIQMTAQGAAPALAPLGILMEEPLNFIDIAPCQYLYAGKCSSVIIEAYEGFEKQFKAAQAGIVAPSAAESKIISSTSDTQATNNMKKTAKVTQFQK